MAVVAGIITTVGTLGGGSRRFYRDFSVANSITSMVHSAALAVRSICNECNFGRRFKLKTLSNLTGHLIGGFLKSLQACNLKRLHTVAPKSQ